MQTRSQIMEAAEKTFYNRGISRTTLAEIAAIAGVTRGAIYWHFKDKAGLLQAMLESLHEPLDNLATAGESPNETDPLGCMRQLLVTLLQRVALDAKARRITEILFHRCELTDALSGLREQRRIDSVECNGRIEQSLRNAIHRGQLPVTLDTVRAAICLHAYIDGLISQWLLVPESFSLQRDAELLVDSALGMLCETQVLCK
jgi:TetR/AcrR family transcriptional regulator, acrAB operon repressor